MVCFIKDAYYLLASSIVENKEHKLTQIVPLPYTSLDY